jgi:hypothetical protein
MDNSLYWMGHIYEGGTAYGVAVSQEGTMFEGTIFLANLDDGLRAYGHNILSFNKGAHIDDGGEANGVAILGGGTIFLANGSDGLRAYTYNGSSFTNTVGGMPETLQ